MADLEEPLGSSQAEAELEHENAPHEGDVEDAEWEQRLVELKKTWKVVADPKTKQEYYWNTQTNETSWKNPFRKPGEESSSSSEGEEEDSDVEEDNAATTAQQDEETSAGYAYYDPQPAYHDAPLPPTTVPPPVVAYTSTAATSYLDALLDRIDAGGESSTAAETATATVNAYYDQQALGLGGMGLADMPAHLRPYHQQYQQILANDPTKSVENQQQPPLHMPQQFEDYTVTGQFNKKTGRFEGARAQERRRLAQSQSSDLRQLGHFFDYDAWVEQKNAERQQSQSSGAAVEKKKRVTKAEIEEFKRKRMDRKRRKFED